MSKKDAEFEGFLRGLETARRTALEVEQDGGRVSDELNRMIRMRRSTRHHAPDDKEAAGRGNADHEMLLLQQCAGHGDDYPVRAESVGS